MNEIVEQVFDYLRGIWRNRWYALGCAWLICVLGWVVVSILPDQYQARARVFVDTQSILRPLLQGLAVEANPDAQVGLVARTLLSRPNLEQIAQQSGLDKEAKEDPAAMDRLLNGLNQRINLIGAGRENPNLYSIAFEDRDPRLAKQVIQAVVDVFQVNLVGDTQEDAEAARQFLDGQVAQYEARLREAENRLKEFKLRNVGRMPSEGQTYNTRLQQAATDLSAVRLELTQVENRRNSLQRQLQDALQQQLRGDSEVVVLPIDQRIQTLQQNLDELLIRFTEKHPDVDILKQTIADLKKQREQDRVRYTASLAESGGSARGQNVNTVYQQLKVRIAEEEANIASLRTRADEYVRRYQELQAQISTLPKIEAELAALNRDYEVNRQQHDQLLSRRESARLSQEAEQSKQDIRFKIIDPPQVPLKPSGPKRLLLMAMVLGAGLGAGVGLAFLIAQLWPTFDSRRSLMRIADIPVFGSVGLVLSPAAQRRARSQTVIYFSLVGVLLLTFAGLVVAQKLNLLAPFQL
jgi:polysaccharide chain length determinant protein (PEP-CTERM system associated)